MEGYSGVLVDAVSSNSSFYLLPSESLLPGDFSPHLNSEEPFSSCMGGRYPPLTSPRPLEFAWFEVGAVNFSLRVRAWLQLN